MSIHKKLIEEIERKLPGHIKPVMYLMDVLSCGKEAAYRRWSGKCDFSMKELVTLCSNLELSLDALIGQANNTRIFFDMPVDISQKTKILVANMLKRSIFVLQKLTQANESKIIVALNHLPFHCLPSVCLFKLQYYKYLHSFNEISYNHRLADVAIPPDVLSLYNENVLLFNKLNNIFCVIDKYTFSKIFDEITYFCQLQIFNNEEKALLKQELLQLIGFLKKVMFTGTNFQNMNYQLYYSPIAINASCIYYEYNKQNIVQFWIYHEPIIIHDSPLIADMQKNSIDSIVRYSVLITKSNNMLQSEILTDLEKRVNEILL